jgi:hypothetical protein
MHDRTAVAARTLYAALLSIIQAAAAVRGEISDYDIPRRGAAVSTRARRLPSNNLSAVPRPVAGGPRGVDVRPLVE